jgi:hypothetical protein
MKKQGHPAHNGAPNFISLLTGWVQQGVESFFATQQILVDVATRQNVVKTLREGAIDPEHSPLAILTELAMEGTSSFIEAQKILLNLAHQESEIMMNSGKERIAGSARAVAVTDLIRRSLDTFVKMQHDFLTTTSKQTLHWLEAVKAGKGYQDHHLVDFAREGMEIFVQAQKKFLDVIAQETARAETHLPDSLSAYGEPHGRRRQEFCHCGKGLDRLDDQAPQRIEGPAPQSGESESRACRRLMHWCNWLGLFGWAYNLRRSAAIFTL